MAGIEFNDKDFKKKIKTLKQETMPTLIEKGLGKACLQLLNDCVMIAPTVPVKEGWLRGSGSIFINNKLLAMSPFGKPGKASMSHTEEIPKYQMVGLVGFNVPYAEKTHESTGMKFREPSAGAKYVLKKLQQNRDVYISIIAQTVGKQK